MKNIELHLAIIALIVAVITFTYVVVPQKCDNALVLPEDVCEMEGLTFPNC